VNISENYVRTIGKGGKERIIQIYEPNVIKALKLYKNLFKNEIEVTKYFFVNRLTKKLSEQSVRFMLNKYVTKAGSSKHITPHMFRHTFATMFLESDVDIRYVQHLLGHSSIKTTEIYTHVSMSLGDCSFYKQVMNSCSYYDVSMNIDSIGQVFGLNQEIIKNVTYIFLGKEYGNIKEFGIERLIDAFRQKEWVYEEILLKHNCGKTSNYELITEITDYFSRQISEKKIIKQDEFEFFIMILELLKHSEKLPLFALIYSYQKLYENINKLQYKLNDLTLVNVKSFMNQIIILINEMLEEYYRFAALDKTTEPTHTIAIHYESKEIIYFNTIINELNKIFNLGIHDSAKLVEIKNGTYIEIIVATVLGITALQFFLYGVNGVLLQLIDLKAKWKVLTSKNPPRYIMSLTREGKQIQPEACGIILNSIKDKNLNSTFIQYASKLKDTEFVSENMGDSLNTKNDRDS